MAAKKGAKRGAPPSVGIIMGSQSDWATMRHASETLDALAIPHEARIVSAHRTPTRLYAYARSAKRRGIKVIIAGDGGAAHLPGMTAAMTPLPVLGVPVESASRVSEAWRMVAQSDWLPMMIPTDGGAPRLAPFLAAI